MAMLSAPCPKCGQGLQIPGDLQEFSCMYCGVRLTRDDLLQDGADALYACVAERIGGCVTNHRDALQYLQPKKYTPHYEAYKSSCGDFFKELNSLPAAFHEKLADALLDHIDQWVAENKKPLQSADGLLDDVKFTLCLLFVPAAREEAPWQGTAFCTMLREKWLARHPKHIFQLTSFEDISQGFDRKKLCFITTAACTWQGKADDCAELTAFRTFRDGWLAAQPDGEALIEEYYRIAPGLVTAMNVTQPDILYPALWAEHLKPCYDALLRGDHADCKRRYMHMVRTLSQKFN